MKIPALTALIPLAGLTAAAYTVDWSTTDAGGGTSTGGAYSVSGSIGQPDAAAMSGGSYTVTGGFWAMPEVITVPGGPALTIARDGTTAVRLRWPAPATGWRVQFSEDMQTWFTLASSPVMNGSDWTVSVPVIPGNVKLYFRLALN